MLLFFFSEIFLPWGDKQKIQYINNRHRSRGAHCSRRVGLTRAKPFPLLSQLGTTTSQTGPHGTWLTTTKCNLVGQQVKRNNGSL